jgi:uncharacterized protein (DUF1800 family)
MWQPVAAAHLLSRAGFGATPAQVAAAARRSPESVVEALLAFPPDEDPIPPPAWTQEPDADLRPAPGAFRMLSEEERREAARERRRDERRKLSELQAWWLYRMRYSRAPLQEKLTLFWHGHFATSARKVKSAYVLYKQNETFRRLAKGNWEALVVAVAQDPAMLIYLDNAQNNKRAPNENFARELMELFTLGEGHYTEEDIKEAARAFTGWTLERGRFAFADAHARHDGGNKTFFHQRGHFEGEDIVRIILQQPPAPEFIVRKLWSFFAYDDPEPQVVQPLAKLLRSGGYELEPVLRTMFLSHAFYSRKAARTQIKSPVQWLVGSARALDAPLPPGPACADALSQLGQELFAPPNVRGWVGGYSWVTTANLLQRYNFAGALVQGGRLGGQRITSPVDAAALLSDEDRATVESAVNSLQWRLFESPLREQDRAAFLDYAKALPEPAEWKDRHIRKLLHVMMSTPQYQLT